MQFTNLTAISPLDGRYANKLNELRPIASEFGLIYYRFKVEIHWLLFLAENQLADMPGISEKDKTWILNLITGFDLSAAEQIKAIEQTTNHDIKAIEYYLNHLLLEHPSLAPLVPFIHFACTSEDINNTAYSLMLRDIQQQLLAPHLQVITNQLTVMAEQYAGIAMLSRTHGQPASPTTLGKELMNFVMRLARQQQQWLALPFLAKFNGAVGNFNAHYSAYPEIDWPAFSERFLQHLGLTPNSHTTQIEPHDNLAEWLHQLIRINTILIDLCRDVWGYVGIGYFQQSRVADEVGSSTMPHKVNPIDFENAEGNLGVANALADHLALKLPISRWQRDLTDSTVLRNLGSIAAYSLIAYQSLSKGLNKLRADEGRINADLQQHPEVLAEAIQTVMRRYGIMDAYDRLKQLTRGEAIDVAKLAAFINQQPLPSDVKKILCGLTPQNYLGCAIRLATPSKHLPQTAVK